MGGKKKEKKKHVVSVYKNIYVEIDSRVCLVVYYGKLLTFMQR